MSDHEADDPALAGFVTLQKERLQSLTRLQQNYKKDSASRKTESFYMKRMHQIESLTAAFETTHQVIICTEGYAKTDYHAKKIAVSFEVLYVETYCLVAEGQRIKFPVTPSSASAPAAESTVADARVHMPQLPVPKCSGNCVDWPGYYVAFTRLIHQNERLDNIQQFHFLKESRKFRIFVNFL